MRDLNRSETPRKLGWMALMIIAVLAFTAACGASVRESDESTARSGEVTEAPTLPVVSPTLEPGSEETAEDLTTTPEPTTVTEPYPTDTEYVGPAFDYTRMPGHYIQTGEDFGIETYHSPLDKNANGIDDQTDILLGAKKYLERKPQYNASSYFAGGYPEINENGVWEGVCTDVVAAGLLAAGYEFKSLVDADIQNHPEWFTTELAEQGLGREGAFDIGEDKIDFRRVRVLYPFFEHRAEKLTTDITDIEAWQPGDIVIFFGSSGIWNGHIAIISDRRADDGVPYVLHHANEGQTLYEEDYLTSTNKTIVGHYRWNGFDGE